ncbi:MAG TPA: carboxymuconolactone decarboxylase family protein, partial [Mycobacteriales bacterium]
VLRAHLTDEQILEFTYITMTYTLHAVMSVALRTEYDAREDPIVEIAAPEGYQSANIGRAISGRDDGQ